MHHAPPDDPGFEGPAVVGGSGLVGFTIGDEPGVVGFTMGVSFWTIIARDGNTIWFSWQSSFLLPLIDPEYAFSAIFVS